MFPDYENRDEDEKGELFGQALMRHVGKALSKIEPLLPGAHSAPRKAVTRWLAVINCCLVVVPVAITVVIFLNDYRVPIPMLVAITDDCTVAISIKVTVMPSTDCDAYRSYTDSDLFRTRRHSNTNARNGCNYQSVFHHVLLNIVKRVYVRVGHSFRPPRQTLKATPAQKLSEIAHMQIQVGVRDRFRNNTLKTLLNA